MVNSTPVPKGVIHTYPKLELCAISVVIVFFLHHMFSLFQKNYSVIYLHLKINTPLAFNAIKLLLLHFDKLLSARLFINFPRRKQATIAVMGAFYWATIRGGSWLKLLGFQHECDFKNGKLFGCL